ncbi:hypothetical protein [Kineococcus auxinigenes]|uniref:hypothetical protein n=1 Tax=unclassified Kineococcus TaxID=2621656 RepID=UPI003D7DC0AA
MRTRTATPTALALTAVVTAALAGCSDGTGASAEPGAPASSPGAPATTPTPLADLGQHDAAPQAGEPLTVTLRGVQRISDGTGLVSVTVSTTDDWSYPHDVFHEPGWDGEDDDVFSGVTVTAPGDDTLYQVARDADGTCYCSVVSNLPPGTSTGLWAYVALPEGATTVDVAVQGVEPWVNVPVSS